MMWDVRNEITVQSPLPPVVVEKGIRAEVRKFFFQHPQLLYVVGSIVGIGAFVTLFFVLLFVGKLSLPLFQGPHPIVPSTGDLVCIGLVVLAVLVFGLFVVGLVCKLGQLMLKDALKL